MFYEAKTVIKHQLRMFCWAILSFSLGRMKTIIVKIMVNKPVTADRYSD